MLALIILAYVPARADEKKTVGEMTFECKVTGSAKDGFDLNVTNRGAAKKCKASCTFTDKDGHTTKAYEYENKVRENASYYNFYGLAGLPGAPLSNPQVAASCE